jgi:hypothetical protein
LAYPAYNARQWGRHIRSTPQPDPELLQKLDQFLPLWDVFPHMWNRLEPVEFYDVIQWLKVSFRALETNSHRSQDIPQPSIRFD